MVNLFARQLRKNMPYVEKNLWRFLRNRFFHGYKFRRQYPIGQYIVDFVCIDKKIILEFDGPHHVDQADYDERRDEWLMSLGYTVLRIKNEEVLGNDKIVFEKIQKMMEMKP